MTAPRPLFKGKHTPYSDLVRELEPGETLMAAYRDFRTRHPHVEPVNDEGTFERIASGTFDHTEGATTGGKYRDLEWFAGTDSTDPVEYGMV